MHGSYIDTLQNIFLCMDQTLILCKHKFFLWICCFQICFMVSNQIILLPFLPGNDKVINMCRSVTNICHLATYMYTHLVTYTCHLVTYIYSSSHLHLPSSYIHVHSSCHLHLSSSYIHVHSSCHLHLSSSYIHILI